MTAPVFVSHSSKDRASVSMLVAALESRGIACWVSSRDVAGGDNFGDEIVDAIERAPAMVLVFSANANDSDEIKKEIALASQRRIKVVPVRVEDVTPSKAFRYELATRNWIDMFPDWDKRVENLAVRLAGIVGADLRPPEPTPRAIPKPIKTRKTHLVAAGIAGVMAVAGAEVALVGRQIQARPPHATATVSVTSSYPGDKLPADPAATEAAAPPPHPWPAALTPLSRSSSVATLAPATAKALPWPKPIGSVNSGPDPGPKPTLSSVAVIVAPAPAGPSASKNPVSPSPVASQPPTPVPVTVTETVSAPRPTPAPSQVAIFVPPKPSEPSFTRPAPPSKAVADGPPAAAKGGEIFKECEDCPEMVVLPAGLALLGSIRGEPGRDERSEFDPHEVEFAKPFAIGRYDVTFAEWDACVADGGCAPRLPLDKDFGRGRRPVIFVSWNDAQTYVDWLKLKTHQAYRLPSEAEWEFAARGCASLDCESKPFWFGAITPENAVYDWDFSDRSRPKVFDSGHQTEPVDRGEPNPFGLFNILGDVRQWTLDCWLSPPPAPSRDGTPSLKGDCAERVTRGGSWMDKPAALRAASRSWGSVSDATQPYIGFRVVRDLVK